MDEYSDDEDDGMDVLSIGNDDFELEYDDEDVAPKPRKSKKVIAGRVARQEPTATPPVC